MLYANLNRGRDTVVVIDEAQSIEHLDTFEELRMLLNYQQNDRFLLTLILIGQSELRKRLKELPQLKQRLVIDYHLNPLDEQDTQSYLQHRLSIAGAERPIFDAGAKRLIYRYSGGVPRVINGICDMALLEGFVQQKDKVDEMIIKKIVKEGSLEPAIWVNA
jgi:general secretion pathway protein A